MVWSLVCALLHRHSSSESEDDGLPTELRNATAIADILREPSASREKAAVGKTDEKEECVGEKDEGQNEETSSKARGNSSMLQFLVASMY